MNKKKKKQNGFTIVELVIVIAVIGILAAILIPTFSNLVKKAKQSADQQLVYHINEAVVANEVDNLAKGKNGTEATMYDTLQALENDYGFTIEKMTPRSGNDIIWDSVTNRFALIAKDGTIVYDDPNKPSDMTNKAKMWRITEAGEKLDDGYAHYLTAGWSGVVPTVSTGLDVGDNDDITSVTYERTEGAAQTVDVRTNGGTFTVNAPADTVNHYGFATDLTIKSVDENSFHEYGTVATVDISNGRFVLESGSDVQVVHFSTAVDSNNQKTDTFNNIKVAYASNVNLPTFTRDNVNTIAAGGTLVVELQHGTNATTADKDKIYLFQNGIYEQIKVENVASSTTKFADEDGVKSESSQVAEDIANNFTGSVRPTWAANDTTRKLADITNTEEIATAAAGGEEAWNNMSQEEKAAALADVTNVQTAVENSGVTAEDSAQLAKFAGGKGTKNDPYLISNANQWVSMCTLYYDESDDKYGIMQGDAVYVKLVNDINLSQIELFDTSFAYGLHLDGNSKTVFGAHFADVFGNYRVKYWGENEIKNITFDNCQAQYGLLGYGTHDSTDIVKFSNVTIKNSSAKHGAFLFYTGGATIEFENCSTESVSVTDKSVMAVGGYVGNGQGIVINNCKFGGSVVSTSQMVAGFVGQGPAVITNSEVTAGSVIRNINAGGKVAVYDGQGGGAREGDNNTFNGVLSCDKQTNAVKQGTNATWKQFIGLKSTDFVIRENGMIEYLGENREFTKITISESIFENSIYDPSGTLYNQYLPGGFSCYWEDLITVENISSNNLYKIDKVTGLVNYVSEFYADKVSCSTTVEPDVEWTRYGSYLDRETGILYYNGVYEGDAYCEFLGTAAKLDANNNLIAKLPCTGTINVKINAYDASNGLLGSVTLSYSVTFAAAE